MLQVRLGTHELAALDRVAARFGLSRSTLVRIWIAGADQALGDEGELPQAATELPSLDDVLAGFEDRTPP
jgi:hypothetical protein